MNKHLKIYTSICNEKHETVQVMHRPTGSCQNANFREVQLPPPKMFPEGKLLHNTKFQLMKNILGVFQRLKKTTQLGRTWLKIARFAEMLQIAVCQWSVKKSYF